jgi:hypothetical protein
VQEYVRPNGRCPLLEWLSSLDARSAAMALAKIEMLRISGLALLGTNAFKPLKGCGADFYELVAGGCRVPVFLDRRQDMFILLMGFRKTKGRNTNEVEQACRYKSEYLEQVGE